MNLAMSSQQVRKQVRKSGYSFLSFCAITRYAVSSHEYLCWPYSVDVVLGFSWGFSLTAWRRPCVTPRLS